MYYGYSSRKRSIFLSPIMIILYITLVILAIVYFGFVYFFQDHYLPNTTVGGISCGMKTAEYVETENTSTVSRYSILIKDRKETLYVIEGSLFDYSYVNLGEEAAILEEQNAFTWPMALFNESTYTLSYSVSYDVDKLQAQINKLGLFHEDYIEQPVDAYIQLNEDGYTIVPEVMGNVPIAEQISQEILDAVKNASSSITLSSACYVPPTLYSTSEKITVAAQTMDSYLNAVITYDIWDTQESFSRENIMSAIKLDADYQVSLDTTVFAKYAQYLATKYNTYADKREFVTSLGDTVIIGGGDYGWVINKDKEAATILENISSGSPVTREPIYSQTALQDGPNDIGDTYIELDYTNQHLYYYKAGELMLESDFVSGSINEGWASPDGIYDINYKDCMDYHNGEKIPLTGADYRSYVDYFIVFARNIGLHDASWRKAKEFGGDTYIDDGSHGCINMPYDTVKALFDMVSNGTPVVAYYRESVPVYLHEYAYSYTPPVEE